MQLTKPPVPPLGPSSSPHFLSHPAGLHAESRPHCGQHPGSPFFGFSSQPPTRHRSNCTPSLHIASELTEKTKRAWCHQTHTLPEASVSPLAPLGCPAPFPTPTQAASDILGSQQAHGYCWMLLLLRACTGSCVSDVTLSIIQPRCHPQPPTPTPRNMSLFILYHKESRAPKN